MDQYYSLPDVKDILLTSVLKKMDNAVYALVKSVLANLPGNKWLMASVIYGAGLRLMECQRLQFQDVDFSLNEILVRDGKGEKDRVTKRTCPMGGGTCKPKRLSTGSIPSSEGLALAVGLPPGKPLDQSQDELYG